MHAFEAGLLTFSAVCFAALLVLVLWTDRKGRKDASPRRER